MLLQQISVSAVSVMMVACLLSDPKEDSIFHQNVG
jgi:hypothetical protein